jgi:Cft2 family RNA processing exonuclease
MFSYDSTGIKLINQDFWLDAHRKVSYSFVSHGHTDHLKNHLKILATPATVRFHAIRARQAETVILDYRQMIEMDGVKICLYPAGHILGSAMIWIEKDGTSLLYTGDFKMKPSWTAEPIEIPQADILIMESTFGSPEYVVNDSREFLVGELAAFIEDCFRTSRAPTILAYSLGKAQEAMKMLGDLGYAVRVQRSAWELAQVYQDFGVTFQNCALWREGNLARGEVLIMPPHLHQTRSFLALPRARTVLLSGWANGENGSRYNSDHAIPLSDHADYSELLEFVHLVNPKKVYTTHGFDDFPKHLQAIGFDAELLKPTSQLSLL